MLLHFENPHLRVFGEAAVAGIIHHSSAQMNLPRLALLEGPRWTALGTYAEK